MFQVTTILHPTDFTELADQALDLAHSLARDYGARLVLVTAPQPPVNVPSPIEQELYLGLTGVARRELGVKAATLADVPVETQVLSEPPGPAIVAAAKEYQADLIVMATHGRSGMSRLLLGSVAEYVLRHAECPVLTIKPQVSAQLVQTQESASSLSVPVAAIPVAAFMEAPSIR